MPKDQEIERSFLVNENADLEEIVKGFPKKDIVSALLDELGSGRFRRFRKNGDKYTYTEKKYLDSANELTRQEIEKEITKEEFEEGLKQAVEIYRTIRYFINLESGHIAELNLYYGIHEGIKTIEVEFENEEEAKSFFAPSWFGKEITGKNVISILKQTAIINSQNQKKNKINSLSKKG